MYDADHSGRTSYNKIGGENRLSCKVVLRSDETLDSLLVRFKSKVKKANVLAEYKKHDYFVCKSMKRKLKSEQARKFRKKF